MTDQHTNMDALELDNEIAKTQKAIDDLTESQDYESLKHAQADLSYFLSLLNN